MYETLRLYGPVPNLFRKTLPDQPQIITTSRGAEILIPGNTNLNIVTIALHTNPNIWGSDARRWNPIRWIETRGLVGPDEIDQTKLAHLSAWAEGPRSCPGKKFSQIEIAAAFMTLFRETTVQLESRPGVSVDQTRIDALKIVEQSHVLLTLQMENPHLVQLRWISR
ncbi:cytochrome P450 monooxygenase [Penicillium herquei]|nr:cytochrome P450 monooxygenase [Penicillium herquei]